MKPLYWLTLEPYTHVTVKKNHLLLYNTLNRQFLEDRDRPELLRLAKRLLQRKNMRVIPLTAADTENPLILRFAYALRARYMGDLLPVSPSGVKPVQIPPEVKIMQRREKHAGDTLSGRGYHILRNLSGLTLYLNNAADPGHEAPFPADAWRQFVAPAFPSAAASAPQQLNADKLLAFLTEAKNGAPDYINILGGDICAYPALTALTESLAEFPADKNYYLHYRQLSGPNAGNPQNLHASGAQDCLHIFVHFPLNTTAWEQGLSNLSKTDMPLRFHFVISSPTDYESAERLTAAYAISDFSFVPYFSGANADFFASAVFLNREDIFNEQPSIRRIQARTQLNPLHFGQLTVLSNGDIHANVHEPAIGRLERHSLYDILHQALNNSRSWRLRRSQVNPCKQCVFQDLCPPVSNYERFMGRYNLCHIREQK